jgi:hypothetical protein
VEHVACIEEIRSAHIILVRKPKGKRLLRRPRHRWEYDIRIDIREIAWEVWTGFIQLKIWTCGELLRIQQGTYTFCKRWAVS